MINDFDKINTVCARARVCVKCARSLLCGLSPFKCLQAFTLNAISKFITATTDQFWWAHLIIVFRCSVFNYGYLHLLSGCNGSSAFAHRIGYSNIHIWWGDTRNIHTIIASLRKKITKGRKRATSCKCPTCSSTSSQIIQEKRKH